MFKFGSAEPTSVSSKMDSRKVSSLSILSDASSDCNSPRAMNLIVENIGHIPLNEAIGLKSFQNAGNFICMMSGETKVLLAELKLRADTDCLTTRSALLDLPGLKEEKRYLDCCILQSGADVRLAVLGERKNKERFVSILEVVTSGRGLSLSREMAVYDKASMLGKGLTHIAASPGQPGEADVFTCGSNLIRKLKMEDGGSLLKPTTGRVQVPPECVDGTICMCVISAPHKNGFTIVCSFRTKSAGRNKFQINWYQGRNDEMAAPSGKSSLKLSDDQEPSVILSDPRDAKSVYLICNNNTENTAALYKLIKGRKLEEPITTFSFQVTEATLMLGSDKNLFLLILDVNSNGLKVFHVMKTQGYRGSQATWSRCPELKTMSPDFHAVSCSQHKWQLSPSLTEVITSQRCAYQLGLATLVNGNNDIVMEPESGSQYRIRAVGGDTINDVILIVLDDIERSFESEEDSLGNMTLKICMNSPPGRDGLSMLSGWLMSGRLSCVELYCTRLDNDSFMDSDRMTVQTFPTETFRYNFCKRIPIS